jgi:acyl-CoA synthetase (AMP-forming)/AMP-acid ligase II
VVIFGSLAAGLAVTTANAAYTANELAFQLKDSSASFLVADYEVLDTAIEAANNVGIPRQHIIVTGIIEESKRSSRYQGYHTVYSFLETSSEAEPVRLTPHEANNQTAYLCYSSGTTGNPKGVELTHKNILANVFQFSTFESDHWKQLPSNDVVAGFLPFYHIYGLTVLVHLSINRRAPVISMRRFQLEAFLQHIERYKITIAYVAPPVCLALAKDPLVDKYDLSSLREVISGAAPLGPELAAAVRIRLNIIVRQASGMSETSPVIVAQPANRVADGSVGKLLPNIIAKVIDENGNGTYRDYWHGYYINVDINANYMFFIL